MILADLFVRLPLSEYRCILWATLLAGFGLGMIFLTVVWGCCTTRSTAAADAYKCWLTTTWPDACKDAARRTQLRCPLPNPAATIPSRSPFLSR